MNNYYFKKWVNHLCWCLSDVVWPLYFSQDQAQLSMEYFVSNLTQTDQAVLTVILQEIKALGLTHPDLLAQNMDKIGKLSQNGSSAVRILVQQLKEDNKKRQAFI